VENPVSRRETAILVFFVALFAASDVLNYKSHDQSAHSYLNTITEFSAAMIIDVLIHVWKRQRPGMPLQKNFGVEDDY
jgi:hypothetical protein